MSKCISVHGEYSEHEYTTKPMCDYCGQISEMIALAQNEAMKNALEQIQELHKPKHGERPESYDVDYAEPRNWIKYTICANCHTAYPCSTRKLADAVLEGAK